jgi:hypothetical protein
MPVPAGVTIRRAVVADAPDLACLHHECWDDAYTGLVPQQVLDEWRSDLEGRVERWRGQLVDGTAKHAPEGLHLRMVRRTRR